MCTSHCISILFFKRFLQKTFTLLAAVSIIVTQQVLAQVTDDFADGNFDSNPAWSGIDSKFTIAAAQLKLQAPALAENAFLTTPNAAINNATWQFYVRLEFNPSSTNFTRIYLTSDQSDLSAPLNGYFVMIGGSTDEISLYRQTGITRSKIIDGLDGRVNLAIVSASIKVTRDAVGNWELMSDVGLTGSFASEGVVQESSYTSSNYLGVYCEYTATRSDKFFFDDFTVAGDAYADTDAPLLESIEVLNQKQIKLVFSEAIDEASAEQISNYLIGTESPISALLLSDAQSLELTFQDDFPNGLTSSLQLSGILDLSGNAIVPSSEPFVYFIPVPTSFKDVIMTELFPDFSPSVGLPENEFVEILNRGPNPIDLAGWKLSDGTSTGVFPSRILLPGDYVILCSNASVDALNPFGATMGITGFPALNNSADKLVLSDAIDNVIDSVHYYSTWYHSDDKNDGGWTLELINPNDFCKHEQNWNVSESLTGGTPGTINSIHSDTPDNEGPYFVSVTQTSPTELALNFNERLSAEPLSINNINFQPTLQIENVSLASSLHEIKVILSTAIEEDRMYQLTIIGIQDCPGNEIPVEHAVQFLNFDNTPPQVDSIRASTINEIDVFISEKVAEPVSTTSFEMNGENPISAVLSADKKVIRLNFTDSFQNGFEQELLIVDLPDINGNKLSATESFMYFMPYPYKLKDIIITEIFADFSPVIGLPEGEFLEIMNRSEHPIDLKNWTITDGSSVGNLPQTILLPDSFLILTSTTNADALSNFGKALAVSNFPSLNNSADLIALIDKDGIVIDSAHYELSWYHDEDKKDGGWSIELIDPDDFCKGSENWLASIHEQGGTPGKINSVFKDIVDREGPTIEQVLQASTSEVEIVFNESLDPALPPPSSFIIEPDLQLQNVDLKNQKRIVLSFYEQIQPGKMYKIIVSDVYDCPGNAIEDEYSTGYINFDNSSPTIDSIKVLSAKEVGLFFSEALDTQSAVTVSNYLRNGSAPVSAVAADAKNIVLSFESSFENGVIQTLEINNVSDVNGNSISSNVEFFFFEEHPYFFKDIIVTELLPDPAPVVGLPEGEFVEIFNRSTVPIDIGNWMITDGSTTGKMTNAILLPGEYGIVCAKALSNLYSQFGKVITVGTLPSLNNAGDLILIRDEEGVTIDSIMYSDTWYRDEQARDGGVSLELIDVNNICAEGANWIASMDDQGGTPGGENSVNANKPDILGPKLTAAIAKSEFLIQIDFDEKLEKSVPEKASFSIRPELTISSIAFTDPGLKSFSITLESPIVAGVLYNIVVTEVYDCSGNKITDENTLEFALPEKAEANDVLINEVLFNPRTGGVDFVELYNRSDKFINLRDLNLANIDTVYRNIKSIASSDLLLHPNQYLAITTDKTILSNEYPAAPLERFHEIHSLPSLTDAEGNVVLIDQDEQVIDQFFYLDDMHSVFIQNDEGVSLERISFDEESESTDNWKSASAHAGYATPGLLNSNSVNSDFNDEPIRVVPEIFEPRSGLNDFAQILYQFDSGGMIVNVRIYDSSGRVVKEIAKNELAGTSGFFRWDGDDDSGQKARNGNYLVWIEAFDNSGVTKTFMKRVAIASRF